jgi:putative transposase
MQLYSHYGIGYYCKLFGKSRQAFYEQRNETNNKGLQDALILKLVQEIRQDLPAEQINCILCYRRNLSGTT